MSKASDLKNLLEVRDMKAPPSSVDLIKDGGGFRFEMEFASAGIIEINPPFSIKPLKNIEAVKSWVAKNFNAKRRASWLPFINDAIDKAIKKGAK